MSSHHIVREKQEPALLVLNLSEFSFELLGQLLEWSPTLIAIPETAEQLHNNQIKIDWLIANQHINDLQSDVKLIPVENEQYLQTAFFQLIDQGYRAVNIITDQFDADKYLPYASQIDLVVYHNNEKIFPIKSGFSKWKPAGDKIRLISQSPSFSYTGLIPLDDQSFETTADGFVTLTFNEPYLFIAETI
ncbi:thiamine diphosphokinase [Mucilaginibacter agri]|uniref:Thiamine diphosphokinase n=1 Tax=Mucilaginibacter agri TaxID=2695265 RepID=A0A966DSG8_9SPHI|nr:thiamine diphosphokinase [Mucilaginibacter agri]NCD69595.1 thiamine diphosphokinase [Mucilaginibacter agri]